VRNAVDVVRVCVLHHLTAGLERITVVDNGSTDGTTTVLRRLAERVPLRYTVDRGPFRQADATTEIARQAARDGADWVLPFDADEFWHPVRPLPELLAGVRDPALSVNVAHFVQRRAQRRLQARGLLTMTARAVRQIAPEDGARLVRERRAAFVEARHARKLLVRASSEVALGLGAHTSPGLGGAPRFSGDMEILHAPLRAASALRLKAEHGRRATERARVDDSWHVIRWAELGERGELDAEWRANSYENGQLDVYGTPQPVVEDLRLREIVRGWIRPPLRQAAARLLRRSY
jgi:glycosyltransferase involved in cell wall biosynthesis